MVQVNFDQYKDQIISAIETKAITTGVIKDPLGFTLIEGFFNFPFQKEIGNNLVIGGATIPTIAIVGKSTGIMYTFALKALLPNIII